MLRLELGELDALVELTIVDRDRALRPGRIVAGFAWKDQVQVILKARCDHAINDHLLNRFYIIVKY
jgi:hypothetical protein